MQALLNRLQDSGVSVIAATQAVVDLSLIHISLATASWSERFLASYFQAVTPRTAGFNTLEMSDLRPATLFFLLLLMFIGASPGGTGGGIKTTTFIILVMSVLSTTHGKGRIEIRQRSVPPRLVPKSAAVALLSLFLVVIVTLILLLSEGTDLLTALFETVSAFATVGLSVGLTPKLSIHVSYTHLDVYKRQKYPSA